MSSINDDNSLAGKKEKQKENSLATQTTVYQIQTFKTFKYESTSVNSAQYVAKTFEDVSIQTSNTRRNYIQQRSL